MSADVAEDEEEEPALPLLLPCPEARARASAGWWRRTLKAVLPSSPFAVEVAVPRARSKTTVHAAGDGDDDDDEASSADEEAEEGDEA